MLAETARSKLTLLFSLSDPKFVRRSVSGATPTLKEDLSNEVTVKHVPLILMLSPRWQSPRISEALEIVRVVPPSSDCALSSETTGHGEPLQDERERRVQTSNDLYDSGKHDFGLCGVESHISNWMMEADL